MKNRRDCNKQKLQEDYRVIQVKVSTESYEQRHSGEKRRDTGSEVWAHWFKWRRMEMQSEGYIAVQLRPWTPD